MMKKILLSAFVSSALISYSPALAMYQGTPAYHTTFYSDASHQTQVGYLIWTDCDIWDNPHYDLVGNHSNFSEDEPIGYCLNGQMVPL